jgi:hypothetical protein
MSLRRSVRDWYGIGRGVGAVEEASARGRVIVFGGGGRRGGVRERIFLTPRFHVGRGAAGTGAHCWIGHWAPLMGAGM